MANPFIENSGFSWRKAGTAICYFVFAVACIGYLIANKFGELPGSYQGIIAGVFAFYFLKEGVKRFGDKLTGKEPEKTE